MCRTSYKRHRNCDCISVGENPACCSTFASDHPENHYKGPFKPKLLTWTDKGLDTEIGGMDFMSIDVSDERAPKGLTCPTITAVPDDGPAVERCPLCDDPRTLEIIQGKQAKGQGISTNSTGISAVQPRENSVDGKPTDLAEGPAGRESNDSEENEIQIRAEKPKMTATKEPASGLAGGSEDWPIQTQSQTPAPSSADKRLAGIRGHRRTDGISITNSGDYRSSKSIDMFSNSRHYLD